LKIYKEQKSSEGKGDRKPIQKEKFGWGRSKPKSQSPSTHRGYIYHKKNSIEKKYQKTGDSRGPIKKWTVIGEAKGGGQKKNKKRWRLTSLNSKVLISLTME